MTILKENLPFLELTNVNAWNKNGYTGKDISIVIFDEKCSPHNFVRNTTTPFCSDKIFSHAGNCASTINQFSEAKITMLYNNQENRDYFKKIADTVDIVSISMSANKELAENNWDFLEQYDIPVFASSGNSSNNELNYPSAFDWVVSVGAWTNGVIPDYSNHDEKLDCVGITKINILNSKGKIFQFGGTSCSTPMAASTISHYAHFVKANYNRKLGRKETFEFVHNNCIDTKETEKDGYGLFVLPNVPLIEKEKEIIPTPSPEPNKEEIKMHTIVLDAGHNSSPNADTGCQGFGLKEEDITLDICKRAKPLIIANGINAIMTREGNYVTGGQPSVNDSLNARVNIANVNRVDFTLSVHCNAFNTSAYGTETHVFGLGGNAEKFAKILQSKMGTLFYNRGIKVSNFKILRDTNAPACLLETAFLDNQGDNAKLADPNVRQQIAVIIAQTVCEYFGVTYKSQSSTPTPTSSNIMYRLILDGKQISAVSNKESAIVEVKKVVDSGKYTKGIVQRNTDSVNILEYIKPAQPISKLGKIIFTIYPEDAWGANYLSKFTGVKVVNVKEMTTDIFENYEQIIQVGGSKYNPNVTLLLSGNDMYNTCQEVLNYIKSH